MPLGQDYPAQDCALARTLEIVGERWTLLILRDCFYGVRRFADLQARLDVPRAVLTRRLDQLVAADVLARQAYGGREEYVLTDQGYALWPVLAAMIAWGEEYHAPRGRRRIFTHATCGTDLELATWCPSCETDVGPEELTTRPGPGARGARTDPVSVRLRSSHPLLEPITPR